MTLDVAVVAWAVWFAGSFVLVICTLWLALRAWDLFERLLGRLRPRAIPDDRSVAIGAAFAVGSGIWRMHLPGALVVVMPERAAPDHETVRRLERAMHDELRRSS